MKIFLTLFLLLSNLFAIVELNSATAEDLLKLNGIGKAKSQKIIAYRTAHQCFKSIDELSEIEGISEKILRANRSKIVLGKCVPSKAQKRATFMTSLKEVLFNPINIIFTLIILILATLDIKTGRDFKPQIVSMGVLGTFVGVFIGLQAFDPADITSSVNEILSGLKTAFFTSIVGMSVSSILSITQTLKAPKQTDEK